MYTTKQKKLLIIFKRLKYDHQRFLFGQDKRVCKFSAYIAFDNVTNGQTDMYQENSDNQWTYLNGSDLLPPLRRSSLDVTVRKEVIHPIFRMLLMKILPSLSTTILQQIFGMVLMKISQSASMTVLQQIFSMVLMKILVLTVTVNFYDDLSKGSHNFSENVGLTPDAAVFLSGSCMCFRTSPHSKASTPGTAQTQVTNYARHDHRMFFLLSQCCLVIHQLQKNACRHTHRQTRTHTCRYRHRHANIQIQTHTRRHTET